MLYEMFNMVEIFSVLIIGFFRQMMLSDSDVFVNTSNKVYCSFPHLINVMYQTENLYLNQTQCCA